MGNSPEQDHLGSLELDLLAPLTDRDKLRGRRMTAAADKMRHAIRRKTTELGSRARPRRPNAEKTDHNLAGWTILKEQNGR
jgi:hypothetical protein